MSLRSLKAAFGAFVGSAELAASITTPNRDFTTARTLKLRCLSTGRYYLVTRRTQGHSSSRSWFLTHCPSLGWTIGHILTIGLLICPMLRRNQRKLSKKKSTDTELRLLLNLRRLGVIRVSNLELITTETETFSNIQRSCCGRPTLVNNNFDKPARNIVEEDA